MTRRHPTPVAVEALAEARMLCDLLRDARDGVHALADRRRRAVLLANREGASYGRIAAELSLSPANVQQIVNAAKAKENAA